MYRLRVRKKEIEKENEKEIEKSLKFKIPLNFSEVNIFERKKANQIL